MKSYQLQCRLLRGFSVLAISQRHECSHLDFMQMPHQNMCHQHYACHLSAGWFCWRANAAESQSVLLSWQVFLLA